MQSLCQGLSGRRYLPERPEENRQGQVYRLSEMCPDLQTERQVRQFTQDENGHQQTEQSLPERLKKLISFYNQPRQRMHPGAPVTELTVPSGALFFALLPARSCARIKKMPQEHLLPALLRHLTFFVLLLFLRTCSNKSFFRAHCSHIS